MICAYLLHSGRYRFRQPHHRHHHRLHQTHRWQDTTKKIWRNNMYLCLALRTMCCSSMVLCERKTTRGSPFLRRGDMWITMPPWWESTLLLMPCDIIDKHERSLRNVVSFMLLRCTRSCSTTLWRCTSLGETHITIAIIVKIDKININHQQHHHVKMYLTRWAPYHYRHHRQNQRNQHQPSTTSSC